MGLVPNNGCFQMCLSRGPCSPFLNSQSLQFSLKTINLIFQLPNHIIQPISCL
nr:hypothetical protein Iba_chr04bCG8140 [Ipomoea batatas]GMC84192.1 hypothetical protein Iba_chr04cCG9260 [Ipomoea batatas]GMC85961.1 hypothetical protein Iba_chr04dCG6410 [Ipomoea batatas]GMC88539.1 hypothetical protein Iba_chr04eCG11010 [Ipomoea batatas]GMC90207.1 hypothetical protein Iba_chr04fCG5920 [Ipomoea batatas]